MKTILSLFGLMMSVVVIAQTNVKSLQAAMKKMEADPQFRHAIISLYVVDSKTGKPVFDKNSQLGLATASSLKVVTSAAAFELLGKDYRYKTQIGYSGTIEDSKLNGDLFIKASGDPTFGSWRWNETTMDTLLKSITALLRAKNISSVTGDLVIDDDKWSTQATPGGWPWDDIGNYYGAGARAFNWHENQYDLILRSGKNVGDPVAIVKTEPQLHATLINELKTGDPNSGDNSIIYLPENARLGHVRGTIESGRNAFKVSGSIPDAAESFAKDLAAHLQMNGISFAGNVKSRAQQMTAFTPIELASFSSPSLDSINYWFLRNSVNLFGEAFVKTIAFEKQGFGSTGAGIDLIKEFWAKRNIGRPALNMIDGSGLSPANRVTTNALVTVMQFAREQHWFPSFYHGLPLQNGIKMKSGSIGGVRSYTGYIKNKAGTEYTFAFIINNFDGSAGAVREKMWKLLDILK